MPRIDPQQLLKCLSVLLSSTGGIKSQDEVQRLASLMTKFSKKLVSKCIYLSILKASETQLLDMFMSAGGWNLTYNWLSDGVAAKNWPLVTELVDLLIICPVDINRLKTNACPKLIKTLSKDPSADENVRVLACQLVDQWLRIVRGDDTPPSTQEAVELPPASTSSEGSKSNTEDVCDGETKTETANITSSEGHLPVYKITIRDGKEVLAEISGSQRLSSEALEEESSTGTDDIQQDEGESVEEAEDNIDNDDDDEDYVVKPVKIRKKPPTTKIKQNVVRKPAKVRGSNKKERESTDSASSAAKSPSHQKTTAAKPTAKKTKNDQPKVKSNLKNKSNVVDDVQKSESTNIKNNIDNDDSEKEVKAKPKSKLNLSLKNKANAKLTKEKDISDKKIDKFDIKERKKLEKNDKSQKKMESFDSLTDKEKESLSKFITPPISKLGKIPKKSATNKEEKQSEEKNRTLKDENSENKSEVKKTYDIKKAPEIKRPEKKFSIEPKRSLPNDSRPKTVKTYNSKFRSTGLEEEVKPPPPPPKAALKKPTSLFPSSLGLPDKKSNKRSSPPPPDITIPEKKPKPDTTVEEKKPTEKVGGIKLIPAKAKRGNGKVSLKCDGNLCICCCPIHGHEADED